MATQNTVDVDSADFDAEVLKADGPVLVDFWAEWCGPCRAIGPVLDVIAAENVGKLKVVKVNVDNAQDIAGRYGIQSIPTLILFKGGAVKEQFNPPNNKKAILGKIEGHL